jgi:hypothetical protein
MIDLTDDFLKAQPGAITFWGPELRNPVAGMWSIEIPLQPFSADDEYEPATFRPGEGGPRLVNTAISLDFIDFQTGLLAELSGRTFDFPVKPHEGYIDGSIYLIACHCPVDVTRISFGTATDDRITATIRADFDFARAYGIDIRNRSAQLDADLRFESK